MGFRYLFDEKKATQATAFLIKKSGGSINYMKLIKLIYLANRAAFGRWGRPIVPDGYFSLPYGPVLSKLYSLITEQLRPGSVSFWKEHISAPESYNIRLLEDPETDEFSPAELALFEEIHLKFGAMNEWDLVEWCHANLKEWKNPGESCIEISPEDILSAVGWKPKEIEEQLREEAAYEQEKQVISQA